MVGWLIVLGILALLLGLLLSPFSFAWDYDAPKDRFFWKLSWLGISFADSAGKGLFQRKKEESRKLEKEPEKRKKKKRKKSKKSRRPAKKKSPESSEKTEKQKLEHGWALIEGSLSVLPKPLRLLWKGISLKQLTVGVQVGRFDAQECALAYGAANAAVYTAVGLLGSAMRVQVQQIQVQCAFGQECSRWVVRGKLHLCFLAALAALCSFAVGYAMQKNRQETDGKEKEDTAEKEHAAVR